MGGGGTPSPSWDPLAGSRAAPRKEVYRPCWHGEAPYVSGQRSLVRGAVLLTLAAR